MNWFYAKNGSQQGPLSTEDMKSRIAMGEIGPSDLAWCEGMSDWMPVGQIPQLKIEAPVRDEAPPPAFGAPAPSASATPYQAPVSAPGSPMPVQMIPGQSRAQGLGIASMVCGIIAFIFCCTGFISAAIALAAIITGHLAISKNKQNPAVNGGKGMARAGLILGYIGLVGAVLFIALNFWAASLPPQEVEEKIINLFPQEIRQQMREQIEAGKAKQQQR
ncbi:GYF domain-containing protein [Luteolibacter soli]|uniref:GYF domain-containing protein n=1 Tax=Luteolibacter soli TaxID=3135280 RepID=A0ABU9AR77_9BACT